ncbi:conserved hypothetical protein [Coraliomargarita akajimensis DSM 45221]|uniref:Uncharacterized protein n=1 Tax=Coraliomargarita akajimensis (strain DSM 45221 / IAM 15411 / JCM 23193 / KCTC 12865 / 04OKA010-24) TaxID=583355 RepID=D5EL13_CORAD|nr:conserved hypothetical protein [Coraliomargarita akajimensis DSM 45221]
MDQGSSLRWSFVEMKTGARFIGRQLYTSNERLLIGNLQAWAGTTF